MLFFFGNTIYSIAFGLKINNIIHGNTTEPDKIMYNPTKNTFLPHLFTFSS